MASLIDHALLALAVLALGAAGLRAGAALGAAGLLRVLAATPIAATAAALCALALGLVDLGSDPVALTLAAGGIWLAAKQSLPRPERPASAELAEEWAALPAAMRVTAGACAGALVALAAWMLHNPALVGDGLSYHVPIVVTWASAGDPPAMHPVTTDVPLEAYPLTTELLAAWATGIAHSFVAVSLSNPAMLALLVVAGWSGMRGIGVPRPAALLAISALATSPLVIDQLNTFTTDVPALAWLVCCAALCAGSRQAPRLLVPAVLAAGLAVGTKTTALPLAAVCVIAAAVTVRGRIRPVAAPLTVALVAAGVVGGLWYARNLVLHGSPLWPFTATPWGDPIPALFDLSDDRLLLDPGSAQGRFDDYGRALYGDLVLLAGALLAPLLARSRRALAASAATGFALLTWVSAPYTAFPSSPVFDALQGGAVRYLLPGIAAAALALALAASERGPIRPLALASLAIAVAANLIGDAKLGFVGDYEQVTALGVDPMLPSVAVPLAGAAAGAATTLALAAARSIRPPRWATPARLTTLGLVAVPLAAAALLALAASGYVQRSTALASSPPGAAWLVRQPGYADGDEPVAVGGRVIGTLAGDRLRHDLTLIPPHSDCAWLRDAGREGWIVLRITPLPAAPDPELEEFSEHSREVREAELEAARCLADREPSYRDAELRIYAPEPSGAP
ncbi:MAG TPA: hypothetical protein VEK39_00365 [Solirubrobacterales bacterium]|nr:hypothetical protein [Solirubrobacterales bacterium]